jgi:hypothetical protein
LPSANTTVSRDRRGGGQQCAAEPLQGPGGDEQGGVLRQAAEQRGDGEDDGAEDEDLAAADAVGQLAAEQQEAAEGEGVAGHHPLQVGLGGEVERDLDALEGDVHDGGVEDDHQLADGQDEEREALVEDGTDGGSTAAEAAGAGSAMDMCCRAPLRALSQRR